VPTLTRYRCRNCGHRFEIEILSEQEVRELHRRRQPTSQVHCPECRRTDVYKGW
jgi:DNA-directed RNA polymerase subunit RPC12/RpoP